MIRQVFMLRVFAPPLLVLGVVLSWIGFTKPVMMHYDYSGGAPIVFVQHESLP